MIRQLRPALIITLAFFIITGLAYPMAITGIAQLLFPKQANGSLIRQNGVVRGSYLIGQDFKSAKYFHPRPSAAGNGYDPMQSGGSNLGPTNKLFVANVARRVVEYRQENGLPPHTLVPPDAVTASASGLDPDISPENALLQAGRVAQARSLPAQKVLNLVKRYTDGRQFGILGEPRVNVVRLNMALDELTANTHK